jgi:hypothetical protein
MPGGTAAARPRWISIVSLALAIALLAPALLGACSARRAEPTEPPVTISRPEGATLTPTPTSTPEAYPEPPYVPGPTRTPMAYPTP